MGPTAILLVTTFCICMFGALLGTISGLVPGIHVNTLAIILLAFIFPLEELISQFVSNEYAPIMLAVCVMSAAVVHSAVDVVPSIFIGIPDTNSVLNVLPGHKLLLKGEGMVAIRSAAIGSFVGAIVSLILAIPMYYLFSSSFGDYLDSITVGVLFIVLALIIFDEKGYKKIVGLITIILSGILGFFVMTLEIPFNSYVGLEPQSMFPLLTGLFGIPAMLMCPDNGRIPVQTDKNKRPIGVGPGIKGVLTGSITGWFPGITSTCGATIASKIFGTDDEKSFISMVASIGTASTMFTFITLCVSGKERSGTIQVINSILNREIMVLDEVFVLFMVGMLFTSIFAYFIMINSAKIMCKVVERIDIKKLNLTILALMVFLTILFTGYFGIMVLLISSIVGMVPVYFDANRIHLTGCLIVPVLIFKLNLF